MRLIVTGGAGFIGSNFVRAWLDARPEDDVVSYDLETYAGDRRDLADVEQSAGRRYRFVHGDIADADGVARLFREARPDVVVNFAAESHNSRAVLEPGRFVRTNVVGTQVLLDAARRSGIQRFHHISTCEVYGDLPLDSEDRFSEASPYRPRTPYNASKAAADLLVRAAWHTYGLPVTISNCGNNYGPWQHPEKVIPLFIANALDNTPLPLYRSSAHRREWIHVADHCRAVIDVILRGRPGETYNVGTGDERSVEEIADAVLAALGKPQTLKTYVPDRPGHDRRYLLDHTKIQSELQWSPRTPLPEGLSQTVQWYADHRGWWEARRRRTPDSVDETLWGSQPVEVRTAS